MFRRAVTLPCFTDEEREKVQKLLGIRVAHMMGRKFEEGDWSYVYCRAKGIPENKWSNLNIDVTYKNLGIEHKMLCYRSDAQMSGLFGTTHMHPSATRSIRIPLLDSDPNEAMRDVLNQYGDLIKARREKVGEQNKSGMPVDIRTGWLFWQESLRQFLYFEEQMVEPNPDQYYARWEERQTGGTRKGSKNLWIFEKDSGRKRYSITTSAGAKIQPYFDVPPSDDSNTYRFTVIGEQIITGQIRVWLTSSTAKELKRFVGSFDPEEVSELILNRVGKIKNIKGRNRVMEEKGESVILNENAHLALIEAFPGVSDEYCFRALLEMLQE